METSLSQVCDNRVPVRGKIPAEIMAEVRDFIKNSEGWDIDSILIAGITLLTVSSDEQIEAVKQYVDALLAADSPLGKAGSQDAQISPQHQYSIASVENDQEAA